MHSPHLLKQPRAASLHGVMNALRAGGLLVSLGVVALACGLGGARLQAGGEAGKAQNGRAAKSKAVTPKPAAEKKTDPALLPFLQRPEQKAARAEVEASSLAPALKEKMLRGEPLSLAQIEELAPAGLNPELVIKCLRTSGGTYAVLTKDIDRLRAAGLADSVLDYLLTTRSHRAGYSYPSLYYRSWLHPYDDWHHSRHHLNDWHHSGDLHHSGTHFGDAHHR